LREQQADLTRELILRALVERLEEDAPSEISVPEVAAAAGVSLRTVYRYFPTRDQLLQAASEWINERVLGGAPFPDKLDDLVAHALRFPKRFDEHPRLVRAMVLTEAGRAVRSVRRGPRLEAISNALQEVTDNLPPDEARRAAAVLGYLENMQAWLALREDSGLTGEEIGLALAWTVQTLIDDLRRRNDAAGRSNPVSDTPTGRSNHGFRGHPPRPGRGPHSADRS
jgi:AcrR family transcriptional regulator